MAQFSPGPRGFGALRSSANVKVISLTMPTRGSSARRSSISDRRTAVHEGSTPTIGMPLAANGARVPRRELSLRLAASSCPVEIHVRPQHASPEGSSTVYPASWRTSTIALAPRESSVSEKESAHRRTYRGPSTDSFCGTSGAGARWRPFEPFLPEFKPFLWEAVRRPFGSPLRAPARSFRASSLREKRLVANPGISRLGSTPTSRNASLRSGPRRMAALASRATIGNFVMIPAHSGSLPRA